MRISLEEKQSFVDKIMEQDKPLLNMVTPHIENGKLNCLCILASEFMLEDFRTKPKYKPDITVKVKPGLSGEYISIRLDTYFPTGHSIFDGHVPIKAFHNKFTQITVYIVDTKMRLVYDTRIPLKAIGAYEEN